MSIKTDDMIKITHNVGKKLKSYPLSDERTNYKRRNKQPLLWSFVLTYHCSPHHTILVSEHQRSLYNGK